MISRYDRRVADDLDYRAKLKERYAKARAELERRRHLRIDARVPVTFASSDEFVKVYTENISKGGIYFETSERLSPNGRLELTLTIPGSQREVKLIGRVKHMRSKYEELGEGKRQRMYGYGIQFEEVPTAERKVLERFFKRAIDAGARETPQT